MQTRIGPRCPAGMPPEGEQESYSMKTIMIGDYIKRRRVELGMTQGQLAKGICTVATLSRLEAGIQTPRRNRISALLQRLGLPDSRYFAINTQEEVAIEAYKKDIVACNVLERVEEGFEKLQKLEQLLSPDDNLTRQFVVRSRALLGGLDGRYTHRQQMEMLMDAMRMTIPDFSLEDLEEHYYTFDEIKTLNQIAGLYLAEDQMEQALHLYDKLLNYILNHNQALLCRNGLLPMVLHNYTRALNIAQRYADGVRYAEEGRRACVEYGHYQYLPGFLALLGEGLHFTGQDGKSAECYREAYYIYRATDDYGNAETCRRDMQRYLNIQLETPEL